MLPAPVTPNVALPEQLQLAMQEMESACEPIGEWCGFSPVNSPIRLGVGAADVLTVTLPPEYEHTILAAVLTAARYETAAIGVWSPRYAVSLKAKLKATDHGIDRLPFNDSSVFLPASAVAGSGAHPGWLPRPWHWPANAELEIELRNDSGVALDIQLEFRGFQRPARARADQ